MQFVLTIAVAMEYVETTIYVSVLTIQMVLKHGLDMIAPKELVPCTPTVSFKLKQLV